MPSQSQNGRAGEAGTRPRSPAGRDRPPVEGLIYFNHAASSWPKAPRVAARVAAHLRRPPADARRGGAGSADPADRCRRRIAELVGSGDPSRVILTPGATWSLNLAIHGVARTWTRTVHVLTSVLEHNSVLRPLRRLSDDGAARIGFLSPDELADPRGVRSRLRTDTALVVLTACSNVTGQIPNLEMIGAFCAAQGAILLVDAAQAGGSIPVRADRLPPRSLVVLAGHKGLLGPAGTGALWLGAGLDETDLPAVLQGGTGVRSEVPGQPEELPLRLEPGTPNAAGFAGLAEGVRHVLATGVEPIGARKAALIAELKGGLEALEGIEVLRAPVEDDRGGVCAVSVDGWDPVELSATLEEGFGIVARGGLHCAPLAHRTYGKPRGTLRLSVGASNTHEEVGRVLDALRVLVRAAA